MLAELLPRLEDRFDMHVYSRSGRGPGGVSRAAIPRSALEPLYLASTWGRKALDSLFLDPIHVEWTSHLLLSLPSLVRGRYQVIWHETGLWGGFLLGAVRRLTGVRLLDYAHSSHLGWELPFARRRPDTLVSANEELAKTVRREVPGLRVEVIPQGVDCDHFRPGVEPWNMELPGPVALFVGALSPEKSPDLAIEAAVQAGFSLVVAGEGPLERDIDTLAESKLGSDRYRRVSVGRQELPRLYATADVLLSTSPLESGALVVLEAMACGKPVVAASDPVRTHLVGDAGILVDTQSPTAYAAALSRAVDGDWRDNPRRRALAFSIATQASRFGDLLQELAEEQRP